MDWSDTSHGIINAATQRFWVALGNNAGAVADRMNKDPAFVEALSIMAIGYSIPTKSQGQVPLLSLIATTNLGAVVGKPTSKCFTTRRYAYRDNDLDRLLPKDQPDTGECIISTLAPSRGWTFREAAATVLGIGVSTSTQLLGKALIENDHTMTLEQAEIMVDATERGEKTEMRVDGYGNFFFAETGDPKDPVSVGYVRRDARDWFARVYRLGSDNRWNPDYRFLLRNLDASKL